ncbi:MAG TPA: sigma-70 family RNA polymerase sigma factor [Bryobacteraceae bacterium]|jgi:RNA polymerase sigma-70 factor (ECF subfamily)|nr:sigma-70 family RNA polymerase sigma factor [Bryobacteraceae bacterium]
MSLMTNARMEPVNPGVLIDENYVRRLKERDEATECHFASYFGKRLTCRLRRSLRSDELIEDVQQETLLRVLINLRTKGLQRPHHLAGYVNGVCHNVMLELLRAERKNRTEEEDPLHEPVDQSPGMEEVVSNQELRRLVEGVLNRLSAKDRNILRMLFLEDMDKDEVCARVQVSREYLRVLIFRARQRFRAALQQGARRAAA